MVAIARCLRGQPVGPSLAALARGLTPSLRMAAFRAVENEKYLVRAANTGITAVVDPRGRIVARTELFRPATLVREVAFVPGTTFYARHGDVFAWGCLAAAAAVTAATWRRERQRSA